MLDRTELFVDGRPTAAAITVPVVDPSTGTVVGHGPVAGPADIDHAVRAARTSFEDRRWRDRTPTERAEVLRTAASLVADVRDDLTELVITQNGSVHRFAHGVQAGSAQDLLPYYAELALTHLAEEHRSDPVGTSVVVQEPIGVVATITPWNSPQRAMLLKVAPALAAGCSVVHKPAPETPLDAFVVAEALHKAGLPAGVFNVIPGGAEVGEQLVAHPDVDKVSFTGSSDVGRRILATAAGRIARVSLELGGKSPAVVLDDAPLDDTVRRLAPLAFLNTGQACVAQTRILVPRSRYETFVDAFATHVRSLTVGDPRDPATDLGPLATPAQRERVEHYVAIGRAEGARVVAGGGLPRHQTRGWFHEPTVFADVHNGMRIAREEIFGPVVCILPYDGDDARAVSIANDTPYGLSATVWGADAARAYAVARRIRAGRVGVNGATHATRAPFGGFGQSGLGRETGPEAMDLYLEPQSIAVAGARGEQ
ncbi:aldehyde dehydrogenase [Streptosporangium sp. NPDC001681]|uniref:aldehyde dehydrogenase n=1 Tax=Streptosporangium sp. NPDC001681 TaxID=3154395 RepID=UPI0033227B5A